MSPTNGTTLVLVNPAAGGGRGARRWRRLRETVPELTRAEVLEPEGAEQARQELRRRLDTGHVERLVTVGGDGTAHLATNVLLELATERGTPLETALVLVPAGTGSDFARHLGLPRRPEAALRAGLEGTPRWLDVIEASFDSGEQTFVLNIASAGLSGSVVRELEANPRRGQLSYLLATLRGLLRYRPVPCRVVVDGESLELDEFFLVAVANGQYFGKGMKVAPGARSDDGLLDVVVVPPVPLWQLPVRLPQFFTGHHVRLPEVTVHRARQVRLEPTTDFPPYELDGEATRPTPVTFRIRPRALRVAF